MALWVDRYRPWSLADAELHVGLNQRLQSLAKNAATVPHLLFYGPNGAGKRTRILAFLREIFGESVFRVKVSDRTFRPNGGGGGKKEIILSTLHSNYHIELNPSDVGLADRHVIQVLFREIAETGTVRPIVPSLKTDGSQKTDGIPFKVVVINGADRLSRDAQASLRRTMEKYMSQCRVIMCCEHLTQIMEPIQSRCQLVRVPAPDAQSLQRLLQAVAAREGGLVLSEQSALQIVHQSDRNIRMALLLLQRFIKSDTKTDTKTEKNDEKKTISNITTPAPADWQESIEEMARHMLSEQSPQTVLWSRERLVELVSHLIPPETILLSLASALYDNGLTDKVAQIVCKLAAECDLRLTKAIKPILHLEFFTTNLLAQLAILQMHT